MTRPGHNFDWDDMLRRLEASGARVASAAHDGRAAGAQVLRKRAAALAVPPAALASASDATEVLAFRCAGEHYAFEAALVARVLPMSPLTRIPGLPAFIAGMVMSEGEPLAVVDLRVLLALPLAELSEPGALIVLEGEDNCFAVLADAIEGARRFAGHDMGHCLPSLEDVDKSYLLGVAADRTALLDARRLLTDPTLVVDADR